MEIYVWILIVQLWSELPPAIKIIHTKEYSTYTECMQARLEYMTKYVAICGMKKR